MEEHVYDCPCFIGGEFNAHFTSSLRPGSRDFGFSQFLNGCAEEGFKIFLDRGSSTPTFVSSRGATVVDFCLHRGFVTIPSSSQIRVLEATGHRAIEQELAVPSLRLNDLDTRTSHRRRISTLPSDSFFKNMCNTYKWNSPLEMVQSVLRVVYGAFLALLRSFLFVSHPPSPHEEEWQRYLPFRELRDLKSHQRVVSQECNKI